MAIDGGPAFPCPRAMNAPNEGMSLRDYFAGQALTGIIATFSGPEMLLPSPRVTATDAYEYADAMLEIRHNRGQGEEK